MTEKLNLSDIKIPCGILHDHKLVSVKQEENKLIFSFDFYWMSDYVENEYTSKFKNFTKCDMIIELDEYDLAECELIGTVKRRTNKYSGLILNIDDFGEALNNCTEATFLYAYTNGYVLIIEFAVSFYDCKNQFKKYKNYHSAKIELCAKSITCKWQ